MRKKREKKTERKEARARLELDARVNVGGSVGKSGYYRT